MSRFPWKSLSLFLDLDRQIDSAFDELIHKPWGGLRAEEEWWPAVDVYETEEGFFVVADVPGVLPHDLHVTVSDDEVVIRGKRDVQSRVRLGQTVRMEREHGEFCRRVPLSQAVDRHKVESSFEHGQLLVYLTKQRQKQP